MKYCPELGNIPREVQFLAIVSCLHCGRKKIIMAENWGPMDSQRLPVNPRGLTSPPLGLRAPVGQAASSSIQPFYASSMKDTLVQWELRKGAL